MTLVPFKSSLLELESLDSGPDFLTCDTLTAMAESQRELFHSQIDQLERLVVSQCQLTGMNPLAQEMAAGALSIKIGKKPRDLLNPKAIQYMQSVFSMKDNIGKRETREISALCGVTVRQVNEFFASQRTRVRKFIRLSREKVTRLESPKPPTISTDPESSTASTSGSVQNEEAARANLEALVGASTSVQEEGGMNEEDKKIVDDVVGLMSKETSFSGQVRLMQSVMRINNDTVLSWFIAKQGLTILLTWLGEATTEEQTSVILTIFKVLCHLPLNKAEPTQISAILQAINRLRFYRTSDISNRAKILLSKWTKLLRTQLLKRNPNDSQKDLIRKQRIRELLGAQSGNSEIAFPEDILALTENGDEKVAENKKTLRLLNAPYEDLTKKNGTTSSSSLKNKVRRKVLLVENAPNRNPLNTTRVARTAHTTNSRPLSADDIQKAKLRASYMQQKLGIKPDLLKAEDKPKPLQPKKLVPVSRSIQQPDIDPLNLSDRLNRAKIRWRPPPDVKIDASWQVCTGENSKESAVQAKRTRRCSEIFYPDPLTIPPNPKDPWDKELDFDDSLTPEIPIDQPSDPDLIQPVEEPGSSSQTGFTGLAGSAESGSGPDMELLAVLLKNPELVFALTSGQTTGLSDEQMVSLLDTLKNSGVTLSDLANGLANSSSQGSGSANESLPGSLPSPTPPSPLERVNWKSPPVTSPVISPPVVSATNPYNNVGSYNAQHNQSNMLSLSMNLPAQQHFEQQNPYLGQNASNHQMMPPTRSWDQNMGYSHVQNGYNNNNNNQNGYQVMQNGYNNNNNNNNNQNQSGSGTDAWAQGGGMGESSAVWGYNGQRRNYNGKGWYDSHERDRRGGGGG